MPRLSRSVRRRRWLCVVQRRAQAAASAASRPAHPARPVAARRRLAERAELEPVPVRRPAARGGRSAGRRSCVVSEPMKRIAGRGQPLQRRQVEPLGGQDRPLVAGTAERVLADRAVRPHDPVAGHDQRHGVVAERRPDRPDRLRPADLGRDPAVRPDLAARDLERLRQTSRSNSVRPRRSRSMRTRRSPARRRCDRRRESSGRASARKSAGRSAPVARLELGIVRRRRLDRRHAEPVPRDDSGPIGESIRAYRSARPTSTRTSLARRRRCGRQELGERRSRLGIGSVVGGHAVISSRSMPCGGLERRAQQGEAAVDLGLDGALGSVEGVGELGIGQAVDVAQHDGAAIGGRQGQPAAPPSGCRVDPAARRRGRDRSAVVGDGFDLPGRSGVQRQRTLAAGAPAARCASGTG